MAVSTLPVSQGKECRVANSILLRNVRPNGREPADILIINGVIAEIGRGLQANGSLELIDGEGLIAVSGFVETHVHLDKILWGLPWTPNSSGPTLIDMIENEKRIRRTLPYSVSLRAGNLIRQCVAMGSTFIRSHVDIDPDYGLSNLYGVMEARDRHREAATIEIVAFPQVGVLRRQGTSELLEAAIQEGAGVIGGLDPAGIDGDAVGQLNVIFGIAERHGAKVDIHLHDPGELGIYQLKLIIERTRALGLGGRVNVSHAFCLGDLEERRLHVIARGLADAGVSIITAAPGNWPVPPILVLRGQGVKIACGSDAIRDTWTPFGNGDMLERAMLVAYRSNFRTDEELHVALDMATTTAAAVVGIENYGLDVGCEGSLVLLPAETLAEAVVSRPKRRLVLKAGRVVGAESTWHGPM